MKNFKPFFWFVFIFGLVKDIFEGNLLGTSSLLFLTISSLVYLYRHKFSASHLFFQLGFLFLVEVVITKINGSFWGREKILLLAGGIFFFLAGNRFFGNKGGLEV